MVNILIINAFRFQQLRNDPMHLQNYLGITLKMYICYVESNLVTKIYVSAFNMNLIQLFYEKFTAVVITVPLLSLSLKLPTIERCFVNK